MTSQSAASLRSRYAVQAASDLEGNRRRQQELADELTKLRQEEALLVDIMSVAERHSDGTGTAPVQGQAPESSPAAEQPRTQDGPAPADASAYTPSDTPSDTPTEAPAEAPAAKAPRRKRAPRTPSPRAGSTAASTVKAAAKSRRVAKVPAQRPLLGDVLTQLLAGHGEPRTAKELRDEFLVAHPDREPTPQVVRNALGALVAKGRVERRKDQRSVMYSLVEDGGTQAG
ncbi:hypothetical protein PUR71_12010 [Streptomyces sp. SP17BM10]|uniref:hypothetical protein n=1 Tax=Streptomyces sp. SP17BM10 TaxID=3002530 RepID=UPI002E76EA5F|nr:hypothetical protein [Streptomyces sp. SP17BM10]MEE1783625.1 hypothetical protein [Streptomyces sp. SP17BM10]